MEGQMSIFDLEVKEEKSIFEEFEDAKDFETVGRIILKHRGELKRGPIYIHWWSGWRTAYLKGEYAYEQVEYNNRYMALPNALELRNVKKLLYCDMEGRAWYCDFSFEILDKYKDVSRRKIDWHIGKWKECTRLLTNYLVLNTEEEVFNSIQSKSKFLYKYLIEKKETDPYMLRYPEYLLTAPQLEQLDKAGFEFAKYFFYRNDSKNIESFNRLCKPGTNLKEIFKTSKMVYQALKDTADLRIWDIYRKMNKQKNINVETIRTCIDAGFNEKDLNRFYMILSRCFNGKPIFSWTSLMNYLERLDNFEAIDRDQALDLINDYLLMCQRLEMKPRIDGDSLKREHDIAARLCIKKHDEITAKQMVEPCEKLKRYDYEEDIFCIRGVRSYDDLLDEAKQQHNCVAGYSSQIISGRSLIYVMREKAHPDRSLITVELSPDGKTIRQKLLSYNRPIRNKAQTEFLQRWMKFVSKKKTGAA